MRLEVRRTKSQPSRSTEAAFEKKFAAALLRRGIFSWHTAEKFISGIPDRYVVKGNWIEFKAIPYTGTRRITPQRFFKPGQRLWLNRLHEQGDRTFACILFQPENGQPRVVLCPWVVLAAHGPMTPKEIEQHGSILNNAEAFDFFIQQRFDPRAQYISDYRMELS